MTCWQLHRQRLVCRRRRLNYFFRDGETHKQILFDINLDVNPGEILILTGPSGSGKTTLLTLIGALRLDPDGEMTVLGQSLSGLDVRGLTQVAPRHRIYFSGAQPFPGAERLPERADVAGTAKSPRSGNAGPSDGHPRGRRPGARPQYKPRQLSGGQQQRVAITRTWPTGLVSFSPMSQPLLWTRNPGKWCSPFSSN